MLVLLFILISTLLINTVTAEKSPLDQIIHSYYEKFRDSDLAKEFLKNDETKGVRPTAVHVCEHDSYMNKLGSKSPYSDESRQLLADYIEKKKRTLQETASIPDPTPQPAPSSGNRNSSHSPSSHSPSPSPSSHSPPPSPPSEAQNSTSTNWAPIRMYPNLSWIAVNDSLSCTSVGQVVQVDQTYTNAQGQQTNLYTCQSTDLLTPSKVNYLVNYVIPAVLTLVNQVVAVQPVQGNLLLSKEYHEIYGTYCRTNIEIPNFMINGAGQPNADYYLMLSARPNPNPAVLANALPCSNYFIGNTGRFDRPLAGSINFNPGSSSFLNDASDPFTFAQNVKTGLHEITHALGFTANLYIDYRTPEGGFYLNPVINATYNVFGKTWKMATPRVLSFAQKHYACSSLDGMELEEWGVPSTQPGSHWEERLVDSEYMAGIANPDSQLSYLTLYLFEDTGWYQANTSMAQPWHYGVKEGCNWVQQACSAATWNRYWCDDSSSLACNGERTARGYCNLATYSGPLPIQFQYFPQNPDSGGSDNWNNYCPVYEGYSNTYCHDATASPAISGNPYGEVYGTESSCWDMSNAQQTSGCFPTRCQYQESTNSTILTVYINGNWNRCPPTGGDLVVQFSSGTVSLTCPFVEFFCSELPGAVAEYTFDPSENVAVPNVTTAPTRPGPTDPDNPLAPPGEVPNLLPPFIPQLFDQWGLTVGSTLFYIIIGIGALIVLICILACLRRMCC